MFPSVAHNVPTMAGSGECSHFMDQGFSKRCFSNDTQGIWGRDVVVRAVAACIVHDPRCCTLLREVGFMILNVTHYSEHCLFFKKKKSFSTTQNHWAFRECSFPSAPNPRCVSVFYLWGRLLSRSSLCGVVPVLPSSFYYLPSEYVLHKDITFLLFCCLLVVSFVCLFETRSQVAKAVSKFPWPGNPDPPASMLGLKVCSEAKHPFVLSLLVFPALSWVSDGDKNALPSGYPCLCDCWLKTEVEVTVIRMKPSAWPPKTTWATSSRDYFLAVSSKPRSEPWPP